MTAWEIACVALAIANPAQPECAKASSSEPCCSPATHECASYTSEVRCGTNTDCGAGCTVALTAAQQRVCNDNKFARLIGFNCNACPEDADESTMVAETKTDSGGLSAEEIGGIVAGAVVATLFIGAALYYKLPKTSTLESMKQ